MLLAPLLSALVFALSTAADTVWEPLRPHSVPLAVRSPYLSVWLRSAGDQNGDFPNQWPKRWLGDDQQWAAIVVVDGAPFHLMGNMPYPPSAVAASVTITATRSMFEFKAGPLDVIATFFSPVETDLVKTSMPFSYLHIDVISTDEKEHTVSLYTDVSARWLIGRNVEEHRTAVASEIYRNGTAAILSASLGEQQPFNESSHSVLHGDLLYSTIASEGTLTYESGLVEDMRNRFTAVHRLEDRVDREVKRLDERHLGLGFAHSDFLVSRSHPASFLFGVGMTRSPSILYVDQLRYSYYLSAYSTAQAALTDFLLDYEAALARAIQLDLRIHEETLSLVGPDYATLCHLSFRQAFAAQELTIAKGADGGWDTSDVMMFLEETGSAYANTADVIYPLMPALLWFDAKMLKYLLEPLLRYQAVPGTYPRYYAMHDLSFAYPNVTGRPLADDEYMPVESTANMLIMTLALAQRSDDTSQLAQYHPLLEQWADYLVDNGLLPAEQFSTDDFAGSLANQTNMVVKALIGIESMAVISELLHRKDRARFYRDHLTRLLPRFYELAMASDGSHLLLNYNTPSSWTTPYNLYADRLLNLNLFPDSLYAKQDAWHRSSLQPYGLPLDSRSTYTKTDWATWAAAIATTTETRDAIINGVVRYIGNTGDSHGNPLTDLYWSHNGTEFFLFARPVVGGHFAILALQAMGRDLLFAPARHRSSLLSLSTVFIPLLGLLLMAYVYRDRVRDRLQAWRRGPVYEPIPMR